MEHLVNKNIEQVLAAERKTKTLLELLLETNKVIGSEVELENVVQKITDVATELSNAEFGAFFYNVKKEGGEKYLLYTISGVPKEAFSKFPMPRITKIFEPTFSGIGTVRYDDVTQQKHYGKNPPYRGMPKGHLPVKSYLAVPVISLSTKEVIGGLFFGHSKPSIFTEETEKLVEGIVAQGAIAMENARLFEQKKNSEETLRLTVEATGLGMWDLNPLTGQLIWSERCKALFGLPPDAFIDYNVFLQRLHPDDRERVDKVVQWALNPESDGKYDIEYRTIGGERWLKATGEAFFKEGKAVRFIGTVLDITEQKINQQALEKKSRELEFANEDLKNFTYTISHDIRNPLTSLLIASSMAEDYETVEEYKELMKVVDKCSRKIDSILKGLIEIIKEEDNIGKEEMVDIAEVIDEVKNEMAEKISESKCAIITDINKKEILFIRSYLQSILRNLIDNAIKYQSPERKPEISIKVHGNQEYTEFEVKDNGMGIDLEKHMKNLFQPFERCTDDKPGIGIGLFMIKRILEKRGGRINVKSQLGAGTTFHFMIPSTH